MAIVLLIPKLISNVFSRILQLCGSYEKQTVVVHGINLDHVIPFYNPSNIPFSYNQSTRKSFSRSTPKMKLSLKGRPNNNNDAHNGALSGGSKEQTSPSSNLNFEMIDESIEESATIPALPTTTNDYDFEQYARKRESYLYSLPSDNYNKFVDTPNAGSDPEDLYLENYANDLDYYPMKSSPTLNNDVEPEREDFPVNNAQPPDYAPKMDVIQNSTASSHRSIKSKMNSHSQQRKGSVTNQKSLLQARKLSTSTIDLHTMDDTNTTYSMAKKGLSSRNGSPTRNYTSFNNNNNNNKVKRSEPPKEINHARNNRKITVQIMTKPPPTRSKTSFDLRASSAPSHSLPPSASSTIIAPSSHSMPQTRSINPSSSYSNGFGSSSQAEENAEISVLTAYHERVHQELSNRYATIQLVRNTTR